MKSLIEYINESNNIKLMSDGKEHGFEYVDLGLPSGTMWATCNVGATKPEDEGLLFQFGRVDGYKYGDKDNQFKTDDLTTTSGKVYKKNEILELEDDAVYVNMGGKWKMPTNDQLKELINNTTHNAVTINGVQGMMFTSNINRNQLFIPFMQGYWYDDRFVAAWSGTNIWSSQVHDSDINSACSLDCNFCGYADVDYDSRSYGFSVRGVFRK